MEQIKGCEVLEARPARPPWLPAAAAEATPVPVSVPPHSPVAQAMSSKGQYNEADARVVIKQARALRRS